MKLMALSSTLLLIGCSHLGTAPVVTLDLPFAPELVEKMQKEVSRAPASLTVTEVEGKSPRRVYFSALYHQYLTLSHHLGEGSKVESCPQFHHDKVETDESRVPGFVLYKSFKDESSHSSFFPETAFSKHFSLGDHGRKMYEEISTLCEEGVSDNYYKFDNLVTHYANKRSFHSKPESMRAVLKIPVFANYYLLQMLQPSQAMTSVHSEERSIFSLTQTKWFENYVTEAHRVRQNLIKNQMVQR